MRVPCGVDRSSELSLSIQKTVNNLITIKNMKKQILFLIIAGFLFQSNSYCQNETILKPGEVNLAILSVDLETYKFKGGNLSYYTCPDCENGSLPFDIDYESPCDLGHVIFKLSSTSDTIFNAIIFWMGPGEINYPVEYSFEEPFTFSNTSISKPTDIKYYHLEDGLYDDYFDKGTDYLTTADSVWNVISSLEITKIFLEKNAKVGIYLYPATVGMFDPARGKWIIFLYYADQSTSVNNLLNSSDGVIIYPNPTENIISVSSNEMNKKVKYYKLFNSSGRLLFAGQINENNCNINLSVLHSGLYSIILLDSNNEYIVTKKVLKY